MKVMKSLKLPKKPKQSFQKIIELKNSLKNRKAIVFYIKIIAFLAFIKYNYLGKKKFKERMKIKMKLIVGLRKS